MNNTIEQFKITPCGIGRTIVYDMGTASDIARYIARNRYTFPGGYEQFAITDDGGTLCASCCQEEYMEIKESNPGHGWRVISVSVDYGTGASDDYHTCDHCSYSTRILDHYAIGWNMPGCLPECEPFITDSLEDAKAILVEELERYADEIYPTVEGMDELVQSVKDEPPQECNVYAYMYTFWITATDEGMTP